MRVIVAIEKYEYEKLIDKIYIFESWKTFFDWAEKITEGQGYVLKKEDGKFLISYHQRGFFYDFEVEDKEIIESVSL